MAKFNIQAPNLNESKSYDAYKRELLAWEDVTDLPAEKRGNFIALSLPNKSETFGNDIKERVLEHISTAELKAEDGLKKVIEFLDSELGKDAISDITEKWDAFEDCKRGSGQPLDEFISEFELKSKRVEATGTKLPEEIKAHMLMKRAGLSNLEKMLVFSRVDRNKKKEIYKSVKSHMVNIIGSCMKKEEEVAFKLEPTFLAQHEDVLATHGYFKGKSYNKSKFTKGKKENTNKQFEAKKDKNGRPVNPKGQDGKYLTCRACGSFRHMVKDCQHSYENSQAHVAEDAEESDSCCMTQQIEDFEIDRFVLFTSNKEELSKFTSEGLNAAAMDTCCTSTVAGSKWMDHYLKSLPKDMAIKVKGPFESKRNFQFGNQGVMRSQKKYVLPARISGMDTTIETDVIPSDIPMLLSKADMKRMGCSLFMLTDQAEIMGKMIDLKTTSAGHYVLPLLDHDCCNVATEEVFAVNLKIADEKEKISALNKLHKQFGHRPKQNFIDLLKSADSWTQDMSNMLDTIIKNCEGCIKRKRNPDKPAVAMQMANEFNQKVAIDLKLWNGKYILYMIDMWSRLTVAAVIPRKRPSDVVNAIMQKWVAVYGTMECILNDNGGEFTGSELVEMKNSLNVIDLTTGAYSPWQNGLCERNHALCDNILDRIHEDNPSMDLETKVAWACMAKNSLQMVYGYSPYQLVFGKNPKLPNVATDGPPSWEKGSEGDTLRTHLNALHSARQAFIKSESCQKLKLALKSKIRANSEVYENGDVVYYKRDGDGRWIGPGKVIFQDGRVIFVRQGSQFVRVSANRIVKAGELLSKHVNESLKPRKEKEVQKVECGNMQPAEAQSPTIDFDTSVEVQDTTENGHPEEGGEVQNPTIDSENSQPNEGEDGTCLDPPQTGTATTDKLLLRRNDEIRFRDDKGKWIEATITGRGKCTGRYKNWFNVHRKDGENDHSINLDVVEYEMLSVPEEEQVLVVTIPKDEQNTKECIDAKLKELSKLQEFNTYEVIEDCGQERISCTWVLSKKGDETRARLVARGYEEDKSVPKDSPTLSKSSLRVILTIASSRSWTVETTDIKSAFLQGSELKRDVLIKPPKEAEMKGKLWKLKKCLYGLKDASRQFFLKVKTILCEMGFTHSELDPGLFYFHRNGQLKGVLGLHVDDFIHAGDEYFNTVIMKRVMSNFCVGKNEKGSFLYTGFQIHQETNAVYLNQATFIKNIDLKPMEAARMKESEAALTDEETTELRRMTGTLNWAVRATRPDLTFDMLDLSTRFKAGTVKDLKRARSVLSKLKQEHSSIRFPKIGNLSNSKIVCFTDASLGSLNDKIDSTAGYVIFLTDDKFKRCCVLDWQANKIRRVCRSTLTAEALSLCDGLDAAIYFRNFIEEVLNLSPGTIPVFGKTDNLSTVEAVRSTTAVSEKRLRREIGAIKQMIQQGEVQSLSWVPGSSQLADVLTKSSANGTKLLNVLQNGDLSLN